MKQVVCVQGLGFAGAAMAIAIALAEDEKGDAIYEVIGVDLNNSIGKTRIDSINQGKFPFKSSDLKLERALKKIKSRNNLSATTDESVYSRADIIVVDVDFDVDFRKDNFQLEFNPFKLALCSIANHMKSNALVIIETTVPPGTCEKIAVPTISQIFIKRGFKSTDLLIAHSYERVMPGKDYLDSIINYWRVYSGHTEEAADLCEKFLSSIINVHEYPLTRLSSTIASETAKVLENTYRAINIALISEWSTFAENVGVDLFEVVDAIKKRPTHSNIRYPGVGIGGYCLTKDPALISGAAKNLFDLSLDFPFSKLAISTSKIMPTHVTGKVKQAFGNNIKNKKILLCGLSYREDVDDTRFSPSESVYRDLINSGAKVELHDPLVKWWGEVELKVSNTFPNLNIFDAIIFAVPHSQYQNLNLLELIENKKSVYILDAFKVFSADRRKLFKKHGIKIEAIGVGNYE